MTAQPCWNFTAQPPSTADALSEPAAGSLLPGLLATTPRGPAWRTDEQNDGNDNSFQHRFWRAVCEPVADLYAKAWGLCMESSPITLRDSLDDWEYEYGLPDPCVAPDLSVADRQANLRQRAALNRGQSINYLTCLGASIGYTIVLEEPRWFGVGSEVYGVLPTVAAGHDEINPSGYRPIVSSLPIYFECNVSAAGDRILDYPRRLPSWFKVHLFDRHGTYFECGYSAAGDRLSDFRSADDLECVIRRDAPAHTVPIFDYSGDPYTPAAPRP